MVINNPLKNVINPRKNNLRKRRSFFLILLLLLLLVSTAGCVTFNDPEASQEYNSDLVGVLDAQSVIGQSFISRRPHLNGITIWFTSPDDQDSPTSNNGQNSLNVKLFHLATDTSPIFTTSILLPTSGNNIPVTIQIPVQANLPGESFYLQFMKDSGSIQIHGRNEDAYPYGQIYYNGQPINADIAFRLSYDYDFASFVDDVERSLTSIWLVFPLMIVLWLPGWLLLELSGLRGRFDFGEQTSISVGISLGLTPIIMLWTTISKIKWTREAVLFFAGFLVALFFIRLIYKNIISKRNAPNLGIKYSSEDRSALQYSHNFNSFNSFALILIFLFSLTIRLVMIRDLATPAWVDSIHHALLTRLVLSLGAYPSSYLPYLDISPTAYHPGFHSIVAAFTWLSNLNIAQAMLILGQVLNAAAVFSVYLLAKTLTRSSTSGLFAAIITGFLAPMPAYYTSWGRYTELTGLLILPAAFALIQLLKNGKSTQRKYWIIFLGALASGGLFMVHYRVIVFLGCLIFTSLVIFLLFRKREPSHNPAWFLFLVFMVATVAVLLVSPWMFQTIESTVLPVINSTGTSSVPFFQDFSWAYLTAALGKQTLVIAGLGLVWGMIKRKHFAYLLLLWTFFLFIIANFDALRLPGGGMINNTSVEIMLFIPISILGGYFLDQLITHWRDLIPKFLVIPVYGIFIFFIGWVAFIGARQLVTIINPITILSRNADIPAIEWINENIPEKETIVINPFAWGYGLYAGNDGGYWISPLSGNLTLPPPVLYGLASDRSRIKELSQRIINLSTNPMALWEFLSSNQLNYLYIGAKGGVLSPEKLSASDLFTIRYHKDGVWIFSLKP
ncbi:MAG: hypothetical protein A2Y53_05410 [Chloroflexi bacterium RBG_16_47_49]|nr:MAG: hypothetical protein A2Y53_05410 [Chloroflexi bacterium RBG_16_47_49]